MNFEEHIFSQPIHCILFLLSFLPHQKFVMILSSSVQRVDGSLKQLIAKIGMARVTTFNSTSLPPWERRCPFQVCKYLPKFSLNLREGFLTGFTNYGREAKVLLVFLCGSTSLPCRYLLPNVIFHIFTKDHGGFILVDALSQS